MKKLLGGVISSVLLCGTSALAKQPELSRLEFRCRVSTLSSSVELPSAEISVSRCGGYADGQIVYVLGRQSGSFCNLAYHTLADTSFDRPFRAAGYFYTRPGDSKVEIGALVVGLGKLELMAPTPETLTAVSVTGSYAAIGRTIYLSGGHVNREEGEGLTCDVTLR